MNKSGCIYRLFFFAVLPVLALNGLAAQTSPIERREHSIVIVLDTVDTWSTGIRDGIIAGLDPVLRRAGASAVYTEFDTGLDPDKAALIVDKKPPA